VGGSLGQADGLALALALGGVLAFLVGLGFACRNPIALGALLEVTDGQAGQLGAAEGARPAQPSPAQQDQRLVAQAGEIVADDGIDQCRL